MSELAISERLQPSLLDRLTDNEPSQATERREDRVIDLPRLREIVQRDLAWLMNTRSSHEVDRRSYPNVAESVLNYGVGEVAGTFSTTERAEMIRTSIERAIGRFEPRLYQGTLEVLLHADRNGSQAVVTFDIRCEMWAQPMPMELYLRSVVNVTTGEVKLERTG